MISTLAASVRRAALAASIVVASFTSMALAQEVQYRDGRFLQTLGGVTIQRADEASSDEAVLNMPFLPGDRVWTDNSGRAEIVFAEGEILWIAERSKVDSLGRGGREQDERLGLRAFAGSFGARVRSGGPGFEFRAPGGSITTTGAAAFRVDVRVGETVVSVSEGEVLVDLGGERKTARGGERVSYVDGRVEGPFRYQRASADAFDRWCDERTEEIDRIARARNDERLPGELGIYGDELDRNGEWVYDEPQGYVFVPRVSYDWAPYTHGRWVYTLYGWTWVADEPWGFVTSHYGRWGYSSRIGWHWMPRLGFSGAWVSWSSPVGRWSNAIGWCALGFNDRPISSYTYGVNRASSFGRTETRSTSVGRGWTFANRADMGHGSVRNRRLDVPEDEARRAAWVTGSSPDREFREAHRGTENRGARGSGAGFSDAARPVTRGDGRSAGPGSADRGARIYVRPSPGDSTPELRSDPATTIPSPESRRGATIGQDGFRDEQDNRRSRSRREDPSPSTGNSAAPAGWGSGRPRATERGTSDTQDKAGDERSRTDAWRNGPTRDPLLDRFFRSITRPDSAERSTTPPRNDDSSTRRRESPPREDPSARERSPRSGDDSSARESTPRERPRPAESRPPQTRSGDENRERSRPSGMGAGSAPRSSPPPRTPAQSGSSDDRGARRKPRQDN